MPERLQIQVQENLAVSGLLQVPPGATACFAFAHGAGAGMDHPFMASVADGLFSRRIATLRYQFPYMELGSKRPDRPALAQATVRAAAETVAHRLTGLPAFAGGKSFGGRMTSQAQADNPLSGIGGLVFLGFPLHPAGQPSDARAEHLFALRVPMLFVQGTRDALADMSLLSPLIGRLGSRATLKTIEHADHSFHCLARTGRTDKQALEEALDAIAEWVRDVLSRSGRQSA
jgi:hypothetical protein